MYFNFTRYFNMAMKFNLSVKAVKGLVIFLSFFLLTGLPVVAQKKSSDLFHTLLFLKNDSVAEGYLRNYLGHPSGPNGLASQITVLDSCMRLNTLQKVFSKDKKYPNRDIDSMYTWYDQYEAFKLFWVPRMANLAYGNNQPVVYDYPLMLNVIYRGKHVTGYVADDNYFLGRRCLFEIKGTGHAKAFISVSGKLNSKRIGTLLDDFKDYPEMADYIKNLDKEAVKKNPFVILEFLDKVIDAAL